MPAYTPDELKKMEELRKAELLKKQLLSQSLTKDAYERLARVKAVNPAVASQVELYIIQLKQSGRLMKPITDEKMKEVLAVVAEGKKDFRIKRL
ncbi:MAG: hypothetical protein GXO64_00070 [Candidatus Micrarchaeota archaeon]|nr:hypothetical protein [Candidatus Micrarchaeota archaeon]